MYDFTVKSLTALYRISESISRVLIKTEGEGGGLALSALAVLHSQAVIHLRV
jgi:hypothetical protein